jgi:hypothetical protein
MRFSIMLPWHEGFISCAIMVDGNKQVRPQVIGTLRSLQPACVSIRTRRHDHLRGNKTSVDKFFYNPPCQFQIEIVFFYTPRTNLTRILV